MAAKKEFHTVDNDNEAQNAAERLCRIGEALPLFKAPEGDGYATLPTGETVPVKSGRMRYWLGKQYREECGSPPNRTALDSALEHLAGVACYDRDTADVFVRVGWTDSAVYLDCHTAVVEVTADGWREVTDCPVRFRRPPHALPLPLPVHGGSLDALRPLVNASDDAIWVLLQAFLLGCLMPHGPYPILALHGEKGSAKSTTARFLKRLVDDGKAIEASAPKDDDRAMLKGYNCWVPNFDNLSTMSPSFSDTLCRMSTGAADSKRKLYADSDEVVYAFSRPVMLNGIGEVGTAPDYLDRTLLLNLPLLTTRKDEKSLNAAFEDARPALLGALLDRVSAALRCRGSVQVDDLPRLADFYLWVSAAEQGMEAEGHPIWTPGAFAAACADNRDNAASLEVEASPFVRAVLDLLQTQPDWAGTADKLAKDLERFADEGARRSSAWPKGPRMTSKALDKWGGTLRSQGVGVTKAKSNGVRTVRLTRDRPSNVTPLRPDGWRERADGRGYVTATGEEVPF